MTDVIALLAPLPRLRLHGDDIPLPFTGSVQDLNWLARPLLAHVGLAHLDVYVELYSGDMRLSGFGEDHGIERAMRIDDDTRVWFTGVHEGLAVFACVDDEISLECARDDLARGVAHAVLHERALVQHGARAERMLLDTVAAHLGLS